jgi:hypothetical protein
MLKLHNETSESLSNGAEIRVYFTNHGSEHMVSPPWSLFILYIDPFRLS